MANFKIPYFEKDKKYKLNPEKNLRFKGHRNVCMLEELVGEDSTTYQIKRCIINIWSIFWVEEPSFVLDHYDNTKSFIKMRLCDSEDDKYDTTTIILVEDALFYMCMEELNEEDLKKFEGGFLDMVDNTIIEQIQNLW